MEVFFSDNINHKTIVLDEIQSRHCIKVLRYNINDSVYVTDGLGNIFESRIEAYDKKNVSLVITNTTTKAKSNYEIMLAFAPNKNADRTEWLIEKATEIGINIFQPIITKHTEKIKINTERCKKIIVSAAKQSNNFWFPTLMDALPIDVFLTKFTNANNCDKYICNNLNTTAQLNECKLANTKQIIMVGPEGGFAANELLKATQGGFKEVLIGNTRLRAETAGVVACTLLKALSNYN
jgi:16S rRNA (uracil1498-N3)-methyltransferase